MKGNLENLLREVNQYTLIVAGHRFAPLREVKPCYKMMRSDIKSRYELNKGEFTKVYGVVRHRDTITNLSKYFHGEMKHRYNLDEVSKPNKGQWGINL